MRTMGVDEEGGVEWMPVYPRLRIPPVLLFDMATHLHHASAGPWEIDSLPYPSPDIGGAGILANDHVVVVGVYGHH